MIKRIVKISAMVLASLLILVTLLIILVGTGSLNGFLARTITKQAGKNINGELNIGSIDGNLFTAFRIYDIRLTSDPETLFYCRSIEIDYLLKGLLRRRIEIDILHAADITLNLVQDQDSVWNFMKIFRPSEAKDSTESTASDWKIILHDLWLDHLTAAISANSDSTKIPEQLETDIRLKGYLSGDTLLAELQKFSLSTRNPDFKIASLTGVVSKTGTSLSWEDLKLELTNTSAVTSGTFEPAERGNADLEFDFAPFSFSDFRPFMPELKIYGDPRIRISLSGNSDRYGFEMLVNEGRQNVNISGWLEDYNASPVYSAKLTVSNLDGSHWTHNEKLKSDISGTLALNGAGFDIRSNDIMIEGEFGNSEYSGYTLSGLVIKALKRKDAITGSLRSETFIGKVDLDFDLNEVFSNPFYNLSLEYRDVNLDNIPGIDSFPSNFNGNLLLTGTGTSQKTLDASLLFKSENSLVLGSRLNEFAITADYSRELYEFEISDIQTQYFIFSAEGKGKVKGTNDISFNFQPLDIGSLLKSLDLPTFEATGKITGDLTGSPDSLKGDVNIELADIFHDSIAVQDLDAVIQIELSDKNYSGRLALNAGGMKYNSFDIKNAEINSSFSASLIEAGIRANMNDSLSIAFDGSVEGFDNPLIRIRNLGIKYPGTEWSTIHDSAWIRLDEDGLIINSFSLNSGEQSIDSHGRFAFKGEENLSVGLNNIDLEELPADFSPYPVSGIINSAILITGTSGEPVIESNIEADDIKIKNFEIDSIRTGITYSNELLSFRGKISTRLYESLDASMDMPVHISLDDSVYLLKEREGFSASVRFDSLDLEEIFALFPIENTTVRGVAEADIEMQGRMSSPVAGGTFDVYDAAFANTELGIAYDRIRFSSSLEDSVITIREFSAATGKGGIEMNGFFSLERMDSIGLNNFSLNLRANDFQAVEMNSVEVNFDSDIDIDGTVGYAGFKGDLTVNSSKVNVDALNRTLSEKTDDPDPPLLIEAMEDTVTVTREGDTLAKPFFAGAELYNNLRGEIVIDLPGNTWVTGRDMNFELEGTIRAVKSGEAINLFGDLSVKRGFYRIYGRSFDFSRGKLTFTGSSEFNPDVDFEIIYRFRDIEKELRDLKLVIKGKMLEPELNFLLDDEAIEEKDAISYIVFGKSVNQLGDGERSKLSGENIAMGAALTQLSSVLKGALQESAGVDVFEVTGGEDWKSGNVTIGKYITNKLYLSYDRSFDFDKQSKTPDTEKIMLEYQFMRNLILKATNQNINSGFDLIFRKTWR